MTTLPLYFVVGFVIDALLVVYYKSITNYKRGIGAMMSFLITLINVFVIAMLVRSDNVAGMVAYAVGNAAATYIFIGKDNDRA
jgi:hypothetical protein